MRLKIALVLALLPGAALAEQEAAIAAPTTPATGQPVYDLVAADRETAWRINRVTGEVTVCRIDTTVGLDTVSARCGRASLPSPLQTSALPEGKEGQP